jgi:hypothetical protein
MNNFGPRVGFAWDLFGNDKTSVGGGWGCSAINSVRMWLTSRRAPFAGTSVLNYGILDSPYGSLNRPFPPAGNLHSNRIR